jgi:hypothetical protein
MKIQELINVALCNGFEQYSDCQHPDTFEYPGANCLIMTCMKGKFDGEVLDVVYDWHTGQIISKSIYSQFSGIKANFNL